MKILFLGPDESPLIDILKKDGCETVSATEPFDENFLKSYRPDWIVSYGYRHILKKEILDLCPDRFVNLHISYLPWNRGADPNLWSWIEDTPKGVTIHYIDPGVDTGDIIAQKIVTFDVNETLASSYEKLQREIQELFKKNWPKIKTGTAPRKKQEGQGSKHKVADKEKVKYLLTAGWDTPVKKLELKKLP